uniref:Protein krueppel n=1 Tax=Syphacia muris TaxID=451379 RepID=A0A0N5AIQ6_9BILA
MNPFFHFRRNHILSEKAKERSFPVFFGSTARPFIRLESQAMLLMEESSTHCYDADKTLMETFLSQASSSEVYSNNDMLFVNRTFNDGENYEDKQCSQEEKDFRYNAVDDTYTRDNRHFFFTFVPERESQKGKIPQTFETGLEFGGVSTESISDAQFTSRKNEQPLLKLQSGDEIPHLEYDGSSDQKLDVHFLQNFAISKDGSENPTRSLRPVLAQESYVKTPKEGSKETVSSPLCPSLTQESYFLQVGSAISTAEQAEPESSKSFRKWNGENPLKRFSVLVGNKKLNFKVCDWRCNSRYFYCFTCEYFLESNSSLDVGGYTLNDGIVFKGNKCFICGRTFPTRTVLKEHQMSHTGAKPKSCSFCGRVFYSKNSLHVHERIHTGEKPFQCPICTKCFARQTNYNIHMKLHASGRRYFCAFCGKWFRSENDMLGHQRQCLARMQGAAVCSERPLRYQCSYCEKMFHHRRDKNIHERTHTGERPYSCGYCGKGFTQSQALTIHIRTHTGERPYSCLVCSKDFRDSSALRKHEFIKHTAVRLPNTSLSTVNNVVLMPASTLLETEEAENLTNTSQQAEKTVHF